MNKQSTTSALLGSVFLFLSLCCASFICANAAGNVPETVSCDKVGDLRALDAAATPAPSKVLHLTFSVSSPNQSNAEDFVNSLTDPASPNYHHFITASEFGERFGASPDDLNAVVAYAARQGFTNISVWPDRQFVSVDATIAQAESSFGVSISGFDRTSGQIAEGLPRTYFAPDKEPTVESELGSKIVGIFGLSDIAVRHPIQPMEAPALRRISMVSAYGYLNPPDLAKAYDITSLHSAGLEGQGETIAIFSPTTYASSDIASFLIYNGISAPNINVVSVNGGAQNNDDQVEACLDIETIAGQAPGATIDVYEGPNDGSFNIFEKVEADDPDILSESYGLDEDEINAAYAQAYESIRQVMAAEGISIFVASGDSGAFDLNNGTTKSVSVDASSAYVTGVGGTELTLQGGSWKSEVAWTFEDGTTSGQSGSSGGVSIYFARPNWQKGAGVSNTYSTGMRQVPDVAALASAPYYNIFTEGSFGGWCGTSASTPLWASSVSLIEQSLGTRLGNIDPDLYSIAGSNPSVYHDITSGNDGYYSCTPGWDYVTGWGSADFGNLLSAFGTLQTKITSFSPTSGSSGTIITVNGAGLSNATTISVGGVAVSSVTSDKATQLAFVAPSGVKSGPIVVTTTQGAATSIGNFVAIVNQPPTVQNAASASPNPVTGTTGNLSVLGADDGGAANLTYNWSLTSGPGPVTFSVNGTNAAKNSVATFAKAGAYILKAVITDSAGLSVASQVTVNVIQTLTKIVVSPAAASVVEGSTQTFASTGYDQFGALMATEPSYSYTAAGGGTFGTARGVYTATTVGGPFTITSTSGSVHGTASVNVTPPPGFTLSTSPSTLTIARGKTGTSKLSLVNTGGFKSAVNLAVSKLPTGVTDTVSPTSITASSTSTVTFNVTKSAAVGAIKLTISGTSGTISATSQITLTVN